MQFRAVMEQHSHGRLSVTGEGEVRARPDVASINLGVVTEDKTATAALAQNAERMARVLARIQALHIPPTDLQTVGLAVSPIVDWEEGSPTRGQVVGYRVEDTLAVRADVAIAGKVLDEGIAAGASVAGSLGFGLRDEAPYRDRALTAAMASAEHQARVIARVADLKLEGPASIEVNWGGSPVVLRSAVARKATTPIEPGTLAITASVRVEFTY